MDGALSVVIPNLNFVEYQGPTTVTWVCPENVFAVCVVGAGGGGGGGGGQSSSYGRNGQPGVYGMKMCSVTPGSTYTLIVGDRGTGGSGAFSSSSDGVGGGITVFRLGGTTLAAFPGGAGGANAAQSTTDGFSHPGYSMAGNTAAASGGRGSQAASSGGTAGGYGAIALMWANAST